MQRSLIAIAFVAASTLGAAAQDHSGHGIAAPATADLPAICLVNAGSVSHDVPSMQMPGDEAHTALMAGMDKMNLDMMLGGTATDVDVAFVCSMIPHHQGAIDMAKAELAHGDDAWAKEMAQKVIDAQEQEIADMLEWLEKQ